MGYRLLRRERWDRQGGGVVLYVKEELDCTVLEVRDDVVKSLWLRTSGKTNKAGSVVGVYCRLLSQHGDTNVLIYKELREITGSVALVLIGDFNFPGINWCYYTADTNRSRKNLKHFENNFLI